MKFWFQSTLVIYVSVMPLIWSAILWPLLLGFLQHICMLMDWAALLHYSALCRWLFSILLYKLVLCMCYVLSSNSKWYFKNLIFTMMCDLYCWSYSCVRLLLLLLFKLPLSVVGAWKLSCALPFSQALFDILHGKVF